MACRYSQLPGIDFSENYSWVVYDVTFCILLLMVLHFGYLAKIVNIETSLYRDMEEEIYMECSQGMSNMQKDNCVILNKWTYGLVQAARKYYKNAFKILMKLGFIGRSIEPCLYMKKSVKGIVYVALYIDDNLMIGKKN